MSASSRTRTDWISYYIVAQAFALASACSSAEESRRPLGSGGSGASGGMPGAGGTGMGAAGGTAGTGSGGAAGSATTGGSAGVAGSAGGTAGVGGGGTSGTAGVGAGGSGGTAPACTPGGVGFDTSVTGVALDLETCLAWEQLDPVKDAGTCTIARDNEAKLCWAEATAYCEALTLGGSDDWRLPTQAELATIVVPANYPAIDTAIFSQALISMYWTSETSGEKVICLDFSNAGMVNTSIGPDGPKGVRCVRQAS